jgi:4-hydroxythreonine-4-phosphate dehydrogenase
MSANAVPRIAVTAGEPAGIGPELLLALAGRDWPAELIACADSSLLAERARQVGIEVGLEDFDPDLPAARSQAGRLLVAHQPLAEPARAGRLAPANSRSVLDCIDYACDGCISGGFDAMVTGPVHKAVINQAGIAFSGHTEYLADRCGAPMPVMLLVADDLRVALVTTHLALRDVPDAITVERLRDVTRILHRDLKRWFGLERPRIAVLGLNPHAGESGHLGREEIDVIEPVCQALRAEGLDLRGPLPADTAFTPPQLAQVDAVLAMYHDQGLAVLKHTGFGKAVNVTLGLPIRRTSVDHGTALDLAGSGRADVGSFVAAAELAIRSSERSRR